MRLSRWVSAALLGGLFVGTTALSSQAQALNCADLLGDTLYSCQVLFEGDTEPFSECLQFNSSTPEVSDKFDLTVAGLSDIPLGCSCTPAGSLRSPQFNSSLNWTCVGTDPENFGPEAYTFAGTVTRKGDLKNVSAVFSDGDSYLLSCTPDPECGAVPLGLSAGPNPWRR